MIIHRLIAQFLGHRDDADFYVLQATDAVRWIERAGVPLTPPTTVLDLGCGHGLLGSQFARRGCQVTYADEGNYLLPEIPTANLRLINLDHDDLGALGSYDLVICSNVLEHLARANEFLDEMARLLNPGGHFYLSWTNWLSPWGGHEFSPWHYLGPRLGPRVYDRLTRRERKHTPHVNLFPTYIGTTLRRIRRQGTLEIVKAAPRYYTELAALIHFPVVREFLAWNCALLLRKK